VTQETSLFDCSIAENIAYGLKLVESEKTTEGPPLNNSDPGSMFSYINNNHTAANEHGEREVTMADVRQVSEW